ncbi:MAG: hypothetical protein DRQ55_19625 [Planctomycetota bacterium]|nr:MAG: hypothetical protein DRQ55_19625 [Planctomycetota bacterium]
MSTQQHAPEHVPDHEPVHTPRRYTSAAITSGVAVATICFMVAILAEIAGTEPGAGEMTDLRAVYDGLLTLTPWAWATLGVYAVVVTPVVGLVVTAWEYSSVGDRRTMGLAIAVIAVLATSAIVAILR